MCISGYLVGYVTNRKPGVSVNTTVSTMPPPAILSHVTENAKNKDEEAESKQEVYEPARLFADWSSVTVALRENLATEALDKTLKYVCVYLLQFVEIFTR